jgi:hypothetical protein
MSLASCCASMVRYLVTFGVIIIKFSRGNGYMISRFSKTATFCILVSLFKIDMLVIYYLFVNRFTYIISANIQIS